jgi:hypothetical protein
MGLMGRGILGWEFTCDTRVESKLDLTDEMLNLAWQFTSSLDFGCKLV